MGLRKNKLWYVCSDAPAALTVFNSFNYGNEFRFKFKLKNKEISLKTGRRIVTSKKCIWVHPFNLWLLWIRKLKIADRWSGSSPASYVELNSSSCDEDEDMKLQVIKGVFYDNSVLSLLREIHSRPSLPLFLPLRSSFNKPVTMKFPLKLDEKLLSQVYCIKSTVGAIKLMFSLNHSEEI